MTEQGKVIELEKNEAVVRVERKSACASCGMCAMKPKDSHIDIRVENTMNVCVGDTVLLKLEGGSVAKISLLVYILPLVSAVVGMLIGIFCRLPDWAVITLFVGFLALGFGIVFFVDKRVAKNSGFQPVLIALFDKGETENDRGDEDGQN